MKTGTALLVIFFCCAGWKLYEDHEAAEAKHEQEMQAGYDSCVAGLNETIADGYGNADTMQAKANCADFWFMDGRALKQRIKDATAAAAAARRK